MPHAKHLLEKGEPNIVGSFGSLLDLENATPHFVRNSCDLGEIRLDLLCADDTAIGSSPWKHLIDTPLLFTARRIEEGGARALTAVQRMNLLEAALAEAAMIDIEVASISEMKDLLKEIANRKIPWVASYHDFEKLPDTTALVEAAGLAKEAGATVFKAAARLSSPADLARLAEFQLADHGILVATMGMGPLAPVSRLLCAQCGSVLNYGYLGETATAPGQWDSALLKTAIGRLTEFRR
jgi:3-dehydroquinate dehydratase-1